MFIHALCIQYKKKAGGRLKKAGVGQPKYRNTFTLSWPTFAEYFLFLYSLPTPLNILLCNLSSFHYINEKPFRAYSSLFLFTPPVKLTTSPPTFPHPAIPGVSKNWGIVGQLVITWHLDRCFAGTKYICITWWLLFGTLRSSCGITSFGWSSCDVSCKWELIRNRLQCSSWCCSMFCFMQSMLKVSRITRLYPRGRPTHWTKMMVNGVYTVFQALQMA